MSAPDRPAVRDDLQALAGYHSPQVDVAVRLNTNESPFPVPAAFTAELAARVSAIEWHRYPDREARALREDIARLHDVAPEQVLVANGSNEVLQSVCLAYGGAGRTAVVFEPTYRLHSHIAAVTGATVVAGGRSPDLSLDPVEVRRVLAEARPAITFACSPNNPTGMIEDPDVLTELVGLAPGVVVVDEAYAQFAPWSALSLLDEERPLVVTRTFSKTWSMAAARLGYLIAPSWIVTQLEAVLLPYHLDALKQEAGRLALRHRDDMERRVAAIVEERGRLVAALADLPVDLWPSGANFVLFRPRHRDGRDVWQGLLDRSVLVRDTSEWPGLEGTLRVTIGTQQEDDAFLDALREVLA